MNQETKTAPSSASNSDQSRSRFLVALNSLVRVAVVWTADSCRWLAVRAGRRGYDDLADLLADLAFAIDRERP